MGIKEEHTEYVINTWGGYKAPFLFATNGRSYLRQLETKSGVWFRDARNDGNISRVLQGWIGPQDLLDMLESDIASANRNLSEFSYDLLRDKDGLNLRPYQIEAIEKTEAAVVEGSQTALLEMAAGTGKTRIVPGMIYRFLKTGRFKKILLLVDNTVPGGRIPDVFKDVMVENHMPLDQIYDIEILDDLDDKEILIGRDTKIHLSTVQILFERIFINGGESVPSVADYDLIISDEAHREYALDMNRYRAVLDYFDSVKIVLTADSGLAASENFGKPVFTYS